jgi:hypothetical protein
MRLNGTTETKMSTAEDELLGECTANNIIGQEHKALTLDAQSDRPCNLVGRYQSFERRWREYIPLKCS